MKPIEIVFTVLVVLSGLDAIYEIATGGDVLLYLSSLVRFLLLLGGFILSWVYRKSKGDA